MRILGLDVGKKSTYYLLDSLPKSLKSLRAKQIKLLEFPDLLEELKPDALALEPTGSYSKAWSKVAEKMGIPRLWVPSNGLQGIRQIYKIRNKTDAQDGVLVAVYGLMHYGDPEFLVDEPPLIRDLYLQLESYNRLANPIRNRLRQQLGHEWPEVQDKTLQGKFLNFLGGDRSNAKLQQAYAHTIGTGLSEFTAARARELELLIKEESDCEARLMAELDKPEFAPYLEVLEQYRISGRTAAAIVAYTYPISRFKTARRPEGAFKLSLGMGTTVYQSGLKFYEKAGGSSQARTALFRWVVATLRMRGDRSTPKLEALGKYYDGERMINGEVTQHHVKGDQQIMATVSKLLRMLWADLSKLA